MANIHEKTPTYVKLAAQFAEERKKNLLAPSYSYGDVVIVPKHSVVDSTEEVSLETELVPGIRLAIPIISANMDSITEAKMATFMARVGGIGILHRAMTIEEQVRQVREVKDATKYVVDDPPKMEPTGTVAQARFLMEERHRGFVVVVDRKGKLAGIITTRDIPNRINPEMTAAEVMTPKDGVVTAPPGISIEEAMELLYMHRIEKLPLIDGEGNIGGVITSRDLEYLEKYPLATKDEKGRLRIGAAIGTQGEALERAQALIEAEADVLVVDVLHGDTNSVRNIIEQICKLSPTVPVIGGNVATGESTLAMKRSGAKSPKIGYGDGAFCTTQKVTGTGRSQFTAVVESSAALYNDESEDDESAATAIADGAIRTAGDIVKALGGGASTVMIGSLLGGTDQSPGDIINDDQTGERFKIVRGMATKEAHEKLAAVRGGKVKKRAPQGITAKVVYVGDAQQIIDDLVDGVKHGIANGGGKDIKSFQEEVTFELQSTAGQNEGNPHILTSNRKR